MNTQRRMFRGRAGPTDRRLPKHNARRRKPPAKTNGDTSGIPQHEGPAPQKRDELDDDGHADEGLEECVDEACEINNRENQAEEMDSESKALNTGSSSAPDNAQKTVEDNEKYPWYNEIKHLKRRIRNIQEGIQTSDLIVNPSTYQENVLNSTRNCLNEWRSIARHYNSEKDDERGSAEMLSQEVRKEMGLAIFQLIQLSVQSGPLAGAKPGYFKRCGAEVAKMVASFLDDAVPQHEALAKCMGFSSNQMDTMSKWRSNAEKAVENDKPPSKSIVKKQELQQKKKGKKK